MRKHRTIDIVGSIFMLLLFLGICIFLVIDREEKETVTCQYVVQSVSEHRIGRYSPYWRIWFDGIDSCEDRIFEMSTPPDVEIGDTVELQTRR
jgi:hypothetical protein